MSPVFRPVGLRVQSLGTTTPVATVPLTSIWWDDEVDVIQYSGDLRWRSFPIVHPASLPASSLEMVVIFKEIMSGVETTRSMTAK